MNAIDLLTQQHRKMEHLLDRLDHQGPGSGPQKRDLFARMAAVLSQHISLEEGHFYPSTEAVRSGELLQAALEGHLAMKQLVADLLELDPGDEAFASRLRLLREQVELHVIDEERELFPAVEAGFTPEQLESLGLEMETALEELRAELAHQAPRVDRATAIRR